MNKWYIQEVSKNYGKDAVKNAKYDKAIAMSLNEMSKNITKLDAGSRANYLKSIGPLKNAFDDKGNVKSNAIAKNLNQEAVSSNIRAVSGVVKYAPVKSSEVVSEGAKTVKSTVEKTIGEGANVVITNEEVAGDALYNPDEDIIYVNNKANINQEAIAKAVALHEVTHTTEGTKAYYELMKTLDEIAMDEKTPQEVLDIIGDVRLRKFKTTMLYGDDLEGRSEKAGEYIIDTEVSADLMGDLLGNDYFIEKLAHRNDSLVKKIYHSIVGLIKTKNADLSKDSIRYLIKLASKFGKAIDNRRGGVKLSDIDAIDDEREENELGNVDIESNERYARKAERNYSEAIVNDDILALLDKIKKGDFKQNDKVYLGIVTDEVADKIEQEIGFSVKGFKMVIEARQLEHIIKDHGENGKTDRSMKNPQDIGKMEYILDNAESITKSGKTRAYSFMKNGKNRTSDTVLYEKIIGKESYYVVQAVANTNAKTLYVVSAFIGKSGYKKEASQFINANDGPDATAKPDFASASINSIPEKSEKINSLDKKSDSNVKKDDNRYSKRATWDELGIDFVKDEDGSIRITTNDLELAQKLEENRKNKSYEAKLEAAEEQRKESLRGLIGEELKKEESHLAEVTRLRKYIANNMHLKKYDSKDAIAIIDELMGIVELADEKNPVFAKLKGKKQAEVKRMLIDALNTKEPGERNGAALDIARYLIYNTTITDAYESS